MHYGLREELHEFELSFQVDWAEVADLKIHPDLWQMLISRLNHYFSQQVGVEPSCGRPDVRHEIGDEVHGHVDGFATQDDVHEMAVVQVQVVVVAKKRLKKIWNIFDFCTSAT